MADAIFLGAVLALLLALLVNRFIYRRRHIGNLGRERDYIRVGYRGMYIVEAKPPPLHTVERVIPSSGEDGHDPGRTDLRP